MEHSRTPVVGPSSKSRSSDELEETINYITLNIDKFSLDEREKAVEILYNYNCTKARDDFYVFVRLLATLFMGQEFEDGPHIRLLCSELQALERDIAGGTQKRVQISMPPRSMKTVLTSLYIAWCFGRHPSWKVLHVSHSQKLIEDVAGRQIRDLIAGPEYQKIFPNTHLKKDSRSASRWETTVKGVYICAGVDGKVAGRGANLFVGDDMLADSSARSKNDRDKLNRSYNGTYRSRIWKYGSELMIGTRWHVDDILGYLQKMDGTVDKPVAGSNVPWKILRIPAIVDEPSSKLLGLPVNSSYWPETKSLELLEDLKRSYDRTDPMEWQALYAQSPTLEEGNIFKREHFQVWQSPDPPENIQYTFITMDTAFSTKESADFSCYTVWGVFPKMEVVKFGKNQGREVQVNHLILMEVKKGRWDFGDLFDVVENAMETFDPDVFVVENKASGQSLIQEMVRRGWPVHTYNPEKDKVTRAHASTGILNAKRVWLPKYDFSKILLTEALAFPNYSHDDTVDCLTSAILYLRDNYELSTPKYVTEQDQFDYMKPKTTRSYFGLASGDLNYNPKDLEISGKF